MYLRGELCLLQVLFPMLSRLLEVNNTGDPMGVEETRMRAATLLCKVHVTKILIMKKIICVRQDNWSVESP